jgi:hypothetical protein
MIFGMAISEQRRRLHLLYCEFFSSAISPDQKDVL